MVQGGDGYKENRFGIKFADKTGGGRVSSRRMQGRQRDAGENFNTIARRSFRRSPSC